MKLSLLGIEHVILLGAYKEKPHAQVSIGNMKILLLACTWVVNSIIEKIDKCSLKLNKTKEEKCYLKLQANRMKEIVEQIKNSQNYY